MNWDNITARDLEYEAECGFSPEIDYNKEFEEYQRYNRERDLEARRRFIAKHNGEVNFGAKYVYFRELKRQGLI